jgi:hypothetical protein
MIRRGLQGPAAQAPRASELLHEMFGEMLDGRSGRRVAETLIDLACHRKEMAAHA